jgi:hypothetical protein
MPAFAGMTGERNKKAGSNPGLFFFFVIAGEAK